MATREELFELMGKRFKEVLREDLRESAPSDESLGQSIYEEIKDDDKTTWIVESHHTHHGEIDVLTFDDEINELRLMN